MLVLLFIFRETRQASAHEMATGHTGERYRALKRERNGLS